MSEPNRKNDPQSHESAQVNRVASEKQELELKKLNLETAILEFREQLEKEKLIEEIAALRGAPRRERRASRLSLTSAILSVITTLTVAAATTFISWQVQKLTDRQKQADTYASLLKDLGSENVPARAGAVVGLTNFALQDDERSKQTVVILVTQLTIEHDKRVIEPLISEITSLGLVALDGVIRENRNAFEEYKKLSNMLAASALKPIFIYRKYQPGSRGQELKGDAYEGFIQIQKSQINQEIDLDLLNALETPKNDDNSATGVDSSGYTHLVAQGVVRGRTRLLSMT
ncbi:hypothetical protein [Caballeronia sp. 15711]|uniref:hypothetical protein n=1 Tax=Caballeronia sp. 15711 TaxID=3391029 RepID=UPI0039E48878